jgi:hypothetical protein
MKERVSSVLPVFDRRKFVTDCFHGAGMTSLYQGSLWEAFALCSSVTYS